jgi:monoamine oxidase
MSSRAGSPPSSAIRSASSRRTSTLHNYASQPLIPPWDLNAYPRLMNKVGGQSLKECSVDVAVIGAGLAGLTAARVLANAGYSLVVLEARDRVGRRTLNIEIGDGKSVEIGGQWVGPTQKHVLALIEELDLETFPTYDKGRHLFEHRGRIRGYNGTIPRVNPVALAEVGVASARLSHMAQSVDPSSPWAAQHAARWDSQTFATWVQRNVRTSTARELVRLAIWAVWAAEPEDISLLHVLFYISSAGSFDALIDTEGGAQDSRVLGGSQLIAARMAAELGDCVLLDAPVHRILHGADAVTIESASMAVHARRAIVAMPPTLAGRIAYDPPLPATRDGLTQRMAQGSVVKCMAVYPEPFWREEGLSGQATSTDGPVSVTYDNSPPDGFPGVMLAFLEAGAARRAADLPEQERRQKVLSCLTRLFGPKASSPERYIDKAWAADPWSAGCYGGFMAPGVWTANGPALRTPIGAIHWAGAETATLCADHIGCAGALGGLQARRASRDPGRASARSSSGGSARPFTSMRVMLTTEVSDALRGSRWRHSRRGPSEVSCCRDHRCGGAWPKSPRRPR